MSFKRLTIIIILLVLGLFVYYLFRLNQPKISNTSPSVHAAINISIRLKWLNQSQFAGIYVAQDKGLYANQGLNVSIDPGGPNISSIAMVVSGADSFGITSGNQILLARDKGVPVVAVAVIYQKSPIAIYSKKSLNILKPIDLVGKKIGVVAADDDEIIYRALLSKQGIDNNRINAVPKTFDLTQFITGNIDAEVGYEVNEPLLLADQGIDVNIIKPRDYGINFYGDTIFTTEDMVKNHPDIVKKFVTATLEGWNMAFIDKEGAINSTLARNNTLNRKHELDSLNLSQSLIFTDQKIGLSDTKIWQGMQEILSSQDLLKGSITLDQAFTNQFVNE